MLSPELLKKIKMIQLKAGHLASEALSGEYVSAFKGQGMEFDEVREYFPGDDVRAIDWNVTARMNQPFIKRFREEREMTIMLAVDVSPSQNFGTVGRDKKEAAAEFAAVIAFLAVRNGDKVGLILFSDHIELYIPPKKGRAHVWNIIKQVLSHEGTGRTTAIETALDHLNMVLKRKSLCFLLSDFQSEGFQKLLSATARRHDLVCVEVFDACEFELPEVGLIEVKDNETGESLILDTESAEHRAYFEALQSARSKNLRDYCRRHAIDCLAMGTDGDLATVLVSFLKKRERRRFR